MNNEDEDRKVAVEWVYFLILLGAVSSMAFYLYGLDQGRLDAYTNEVEYQ